MELLHDVMELLHDVMEPLHDVMEPLHDVMEQLHDMIEQLHDMMEPTHDVMERLNDIQRTFGSKPIALPAGIFTPGRKKNSYFFPIERAVILEDRKLPAGFTGRMHVVFIYWAMHWSKKEIADEIYTSPDTVDWDIRKIYDLLGVNDRSAAGQKAWLEGLFRKEDFEGIEWRG